MEEKREIEWLGENSFYDLESKRKQIIYKNSQENIIYQLQGSLCAVFCLCIVSDTW